MFFVLLLCASAIPLSYFRSEKSVTWNPPPFSLFEGTYRYEEPLVSFPIIPVWSFGFRFDGDIMISLADDEPWGMIEVAYVENTEGDKVWFTLDSKLDGHQYIGLSDHPLAHEISALFPVPSYQAHLEVIENDSSYNVSYMRGNQPISFSIAKEDSVHPPSRQNGHSMNHSQQDMMAILNISSLKLHSVQWGEPQRKTQSILWQPISGIMSQTVAGIRRGTWTQTKTSIHSLSLANKSTDIQECIHVSHARYCFHKKGKERQLSGISLFQPLIREQISSVHFSPALPDLRFIPKKTHCSDIFWEIANQEHLKAAACVHPLRYGSTMIVSVHALQPSWVNARPLITSLVLNHDRDEVHANSAILSEGALEKHSSSVSVSDMMDLPIPKDFQWNGTELIPQSIQEKKRGKAYSVGIPLIPKDGLLVGAVDIESSFENPFLLALRGHMIPSIQEFSFRIESYDGINRIALQVTPSKPINHGGWIEVDVGEVVPSSSIQSISIEGNAGGMNIEESLFLESVHIRSKECSFALNGRLDGKPKGCIVQMSMFWID